MYDVLKNARGRIAPVSASASLDAQILLAEVLHVTRAHIIAHPEKVLTDDQVGRYEESIVRRERGEPVAYILGRKAFYDLELIVTPDVLIPRPETEHLLERALTLVQDQAHLHVVDCGTGSGALAVTFAAHMKSAAVYATDISPAALHIAKQNALRHHVDVQFFQGDLLLPLIEAEIVVDVVLANLPYIASGELPKLAVSRHEPRLALDGGADGLDVIRRLLAQVRESDVCRPGALILLEIGADQGRSAAQCVYDALPDSQVEIIQDYAGLDRVVQVTLI